MSQKKRIERLEKQSTDEHWKNWKTLSPDDRYSKYFYLENPRKFRRRYGMVIGADLLSGCFTIGLTSVLMALSYLSSLPVDLATKIFFLTGLATCLMFFFRQNAGNPWSN